MPPSDLEPLQGAIRYTFTNSELLLQALTHRSWIEERYPGGRAPGHLSQQRLEFLGDALLNYVVGQWVFETCPTDGEGRLTSLRTDFTRGAWLAARGEQLGLGGLIRFGRGAAAQAASNRKILEDTTEALLGAMVADGAEAQAIELIRSWLPEAPSPTAAVADATSQLNAWHQARYMRPLPEPEWEESGPDHDRQWTGRITVDGQVGIGVSHSKKEAKRQAAADLLAKLPR